MTTDLFSEKSFEIKLLRRVNWVIAISIAVIVLELTLLLFRIGHNFVKVPEGLSKDASKSDFCTMAVDQMIHKKLSKKIVSENFYQRVTSNNYVDLALDQEDSISSVFSGNEFCKVLVKSKSSLKSLDLFLSEGEDSDFYYQITKIRINELYQP